MGHNGPTFAVDWHPEEKNWVASAGRDTMVKVYVKYIGIVSAKDFKVDRL